MTDADIAAIRDALQEPWAEPDRSADAEVQRLYRLCQRADDVIARLLDALEAAQSACADAHAMLLRGDDDRAILARLEVWKDTP